MRLLLIIPELGYGGAETALLRLAQQLSRFHEVKIVVFCKNYQDQSYSPLSFATSLPVVELDHSGSAPLNLLPHSIGRWWRRFRELRRLKLHCDVAISFLGGANLLNALTRAGKPCILSERGSKWHDLSRSHISRWIWCRLLDPLAYLLADRIVCVSKGLSSEICSSLLPCQRKKVVTISGYLDAEKALAASKLPIEPELLCLGRRPLLIAAGRLHPQKGLHHLLPLAAKVFKQIPGSGLLVIGDGPQLFELKTLAKKLGLSVNDRSRPDDLDTSAQVIFLGYKKQPARYFRLGRAFVLPSRWEGMPNILLEAICAGCWCLAADCPWGPAEILCDSEFGELLPMLGTQDSHLAWIHAMQDALTGSNSKYLDPIQRHGLASAYSIQQSSQQWETLLNDLGSI